MLIPWHFQLSTSYNHRLYMAWLMNPFEPNLMVVAAMQTTNIFLSTQFTRGKLCLNLGSLFEIEDTNFWKWQQNSARVQRSQGNHACLPSPRQWIDHTSPHSATLLPTRPHFWKKNFCPIILPPTLTIGQLGVCPSKDSCWYSDWLCFRENLPVWFGQWECERITLFYCLNVGGG